MFFNKSSFILTMTLVIAFPFFSSPIFAQNFIGTWEAKIEIGQYEKCQLWYEFYLDGSYFMYTNSNCSTVMEKNVKEHVVAAMVKENGEERFTNLKLLSNPLSFIQN